MNSSKDTEKVPPQTSEAESQHGDDHDVIYALRTAHQNQTQHLILADQKANVLIGIVAVTLTILLTRLDLVVELLNGQSHQYRYVIGVYFLIEAMALLAAIMVILPRTASGIRSSNPQDLPNLLHFGYFCQINEAAYVDYLVATMKNSIAAREFLAVDFYQMGKVLARKYRYLKAAYSFTLVGFLVLIAMVAHWIFGL